MIPRATLTHPVAVRILILTTLVMLLSGCGGDDPPQSTPPPKQLSDKDLDHALVLNSQGKVEDAVAILDEIATLYPEGPLGDRAALILGNIHARYGRHLDALPLLKRSAAGSVAPDYARILIARSVAEGGLTEEYTAAIEIARSMSQDPSGEISDVIQEEAVYRLCQLLTARSEWHEVITSANDYVDRWPDNRRCKEIGWMRAEALRSSGKLQPALVAYEDIWHGNPSSPWATQCRDRIKALAGEPGAHARSLSEGDRYSFVKKLVAAGLHGDAVKEIDAFLTKHPRSGNAHGALFLKSRSLHSLRKNQDCVATVEKLRREHPNSKWVPSAVIYAVKALRRNDREPQIREWAKYLKRTYPTHTKTHEGQYNLGVFLGNVVSRPEGISVLNRLVQPAPKHDNATDALWKIAWFCHKENNRAGMLAALDKLMQDYPSSGYRKAALYWKARIIEDNDPAGATGIYQTCVEEFPHDYYGHRAWEQLLAKGTRPLQVGNRTKFPPVDLLDSPGRRAEEGIGYSRAVQLNKLGLYEFAAGELKTVPAAHTDRSLQFALALLYSRAGDPWEAIKLLKRHFSDFMVAGSPDPSLVPEEFWQALYPYNYRAEIAQAIERTGIDAAGVDPYLMASLIRLESGFLSTAISPVGAIGLLQLMPDTAKRIAESQGLQAPATSDLMQPKTNILFGTFYFSSLIDQFDGDWFPAICSYNAGPAAVRRWWSKKPATQKLDEFIETITYHDTRLYIKRIIGDYRNYERIYAPR